jgi:hypothetical protein
MSIWVNTKGSKELTNKYDLLLMDKYEIEEKLKGKYDINPLYVKFKTLKKAPLTCKLNACGHILKRLHKCKTKLLVTI